MDQNERINKALSELAPKRSAMKIVRENWPAISKALSEGVRRTDIVAKLNSEGLQITLMGFDSALKRMRAEIASNQSQTGKQGSQQ